MKNVTLLPDKLNKQAFKLKKNILPVNERSKGFKKNIKKI
jgi:hypothetical protein